MARFEMINQVQSLTSVSAPSGQKYDSLKGHPFVVTNSEDIKFFAKNPKRYRRLGLFESPHAKYVPEEEQLQESLLKIPGVDKELAVFLVEHYSSEEALQSHIRRGEPVPHDAPPGASFVWQYYRRDPVVREEVFSRPQVDPDPEPEWTKEYTGQTGDDEPKKDLLPLGKLKKMSKANLMALAKNFGKEDGLSHMSHHDLVMLVNDLQNKPAPIPQSNSVESDEDEEEEEEEEDE